MTLLEIADALSAGLYKALLHRLGNPHPCEHCGYEGATTGDLNLAHRVLADSEWLRIREAARKSTEDSKGPVPITVDLPFVAPTLLPPVERKAS